MSRREVLRLFEEVVDLPEGEREGFLDGVPRHRAELEALLEKEREGDGFPALQISTQAFSELGLTTTELDAGTRIGSFRIERLLGSGGMGRVHLAVQENPRRQVALKTLRHGMASEEAFQRFRIEGELLGRLRHPGIAQIYEAGVQRITSDGAEVELPYIAMELLDEARSITEHARAHDLSLAARISLVVEAARAVQHAHQRGVIHRDLKPGNILVDNEGRVRVIDFGVARAAELEGAVVQTKAGHVVGTPAYMSPEQLTLRSEELDTRVDVYALGAVLYELACRRPPFQTDSLPLAALVREVVDEGPQRPASIVAELPADVEAVLLKAMARERDERYASAAALADELERILRHETVEARPPTALHQLRLFARRNRFFAAALVVAVLSLVSAAAISITFALSARRAENQEREARKQADKYLQDALDTNFALVFGFAEGIASMEGGTELRVSLLRAALGKLGELEEEARRDPKNLAALAGAYVKLGHALGAMDQASLGDHEGAALAYGKAVALLEGVEGSDLGFRRTWIAIEEAQGERAKTQHNLPGMLLHFEKALELAQAELDANPGDDELRKSCAQRRRDVGNTYGSMGEHARALEFFEEALFDLGELLASDPSSATLRYNYANTLSSAASATCNSLSPADSLPIYADAMARLEDLLVDQPGHRAASGALVGNRHPYTEALVRAGEFDTAIEECETGLYMAEELIAGDPGDYQARRWRGLLLYNLGWAHQERAEGEDDLLIARENLQACYDVFGELRTEGRITPFEGTFFAVIQKRLDAVAEALGG